MTKKFPLGVLLTVTTGRLLTEPHDGGNGIDQLYAILDWMTDDSNMTHQLPRVAEECKPFLLEQFPEIANCGSAESLESLDKWVDSVKPTDKAVGIWLAEMLLSFPTLKLEYDVPQLPKGKHESREPIGELFEMLNRSLK